MVAAFHAELGAKGKIEEPAGKTHRAILRGGIGETRGNHGTVIFRQRGAL